MRRGLWRLLDTNKQNGGNQAAWDERAGAEHDDPPVVGGASIRRVRSLHLLPMTPRSGAGFRGGCARRQNREHRAGRGAVDRLLALAEKRDLREFEDGVRFIRAKRDLTPENVGAWWRTIEARIAKTGWVDVSRVVYAAHLGLADEAYEAAENARLGPKGTSDDMMGRTVTARR